MPSTAMRGRSVSCSCRYSRDLTAPARARADILKALVNWDLEGHAEVAQLIVSELVTNAVRHGTGPVGIRLTHERGYLHVEVHDDGPGQPVRRQATEEDESGRGLVLIDGLTGLYGGNLAVVNDNPGDGKTVRVSIRLPPGDQRLSFPC